MVGVVRLIDGLSRNPQYREQVYAEAPDVARFDPGHAAVMMCYDFHLEGVMPRLIEVNTNAGGGMLAHLAHDPSSPSIINPLPVKTRKRLLQTFSDEMKQYSSGKKLKPERIAIIDENPTDQYLYPEMCAFADLFRGWGVPTEIVEPTRLQASADGVWLDGHPVDLVYNRHCDFYLENAAMAGLRQAYLARKVCLTPNPHMYGLLADKRRMILWSDAGRRASWRLSGNEEADCSNRSFRAPRCLPNSIRSRPGLTANTSSSNPWMVSAARACWSVRKFPASVLTNCRRRRPWCRSWCRRA